MVEDKPYSDLIGGHITVTPADEVVLSEEEVTDVIMCASPLLVTARFVSSTYVAWNVGLQYDVELKDITEFRTHVAHIQDIIWKCFPDKVKAVVVRFYYDESATDPEDPRTHEIWEEVVSRPRLN